MRYTLLLHASILASLFGISTYFAPEWSVWKKIKFVIVLSLVVLVSSSDVRLFVGKNVVDCVGDLITGRGCTLTPVEPDASIDAIKRENATLRNDLAAVRGTRNLLSEQNDQLGRYLVDARKTHADQTDLLRTEINELRTRTAETRVALQGSEEERKGLMVTISTLRTALSDTEVRLAGETRRRVEVEELPRVQQVKNPPPSRTPPQPLPSATVSAGDTRDRQYCDQQAGALWDPDRRRSVVAVEFEKDAWSYYLVVEACERAANAEPSNRRLWFQYGRALDNKRKHREAKVAYEKAAALESGAAHVNLGVLYSKGQGVDIDQERACQNYLRGAEHGVAEGAFLYANCLATGSGKVKDISLAVQFYKQAIAGGLVNPVRAQQKILELTGQRVALSSATKG